MPTKAELQLRVDALENENHDLRRMLARAERELEGKLLPEELAPDGMTNSVKKWMLEYKLPWEIFWCADHHQWVDELDHHFPYYCNNRCPGCRGKDEV